jgi:hypothetical protein
MGGLDFRRLDILNEAVLLKAFRVLEECISGGQIYNVKYRGMHIWWIVISTLANSTTINKLL